MESVKILYHFVFKCNQKRIIKRGKFFKHIRQAILLCVGKASVTRIFNQVRDEVKAEYAIPDPGVQMELVPVESWNGGGGAEHDLLTVNFYCLCHRHRLLLLR